MLWCSCFAVTEARRKAVLDIFTHKSAQKYLTAVDNHRRLLEAYNEKQKNSSYEPQKSWREETGDVDLKLTLNPDARRNIENGIGNYLMQITVPVEGDQRNQIVEVSGLKSGTDVRVIDPGQVVKFLGVDYKYYIAIDTKNNIKLYMELVQDFLDRCEYKDKAGRPLSDDEKEKHKKDLLQYFKAAGEHKPSRDLAIWMMAYASADPSYVEVAESILSDIFGETNG